MMSIGELLDKIPIAFKAICCAPAAIVVAVIFVASIAFLKGWEPEQ